MQRSNKITVSINFKENDLIQRYSYYFNSMVSDSVLWQQPLHPLKLQKAKWQPKNATKNFDIHNDCGPT